MNIKFDTISANEYAMNPVIDKTFKLRLQEQGCSHFLILSHSSNENLTSLDDDFRNVLIGREEQLLTFDDEYIDSLSMRVTCVDRLLYIKNGGIVQLPARPACYIVLGCRFYQETNLFKIFMPDNLNSCKTKVFAEVTYSISPYFIEKKKLFKTQNIRTDFYAVRIENIAEYSDGDIYYTIDNKYKYPITKRMLGMQILIKSAGTVPAFYSSTRDLIIKEKNR